MVYEDTFTKREAISPELKLEKVVDEGIYVLVDSNLTQIAVYRNYVPTCLEIDESGWGDYLEFTIEKNGKIKNWSFTQEHLNEIMEMNKN